MRKRLRLKFFGRGAKWEMWKHPEKLNDPEYRALIEEMSKRVKPVTLSASFRPEGKPKGT